MSISKENLNNFLPNGFETENKEDYKMPFDEDLVQTGYERDVPDIVSGPNLNNLIDVIGKNTNTLNSYVEYLNSLSVNKTPIVDSNNQLNSTQIGLKVYSATETYLLNDLVTTIQDGKVLFYKSLVASNTGNPLTNTDYWEEVKLGGGSGLELCDTDIVIRNDKKIFEQLQQMRRSTFDKSKFTVVGSPTITADGVASGFSNNSQTYIKCLDSFNGKDNWKILLKVNTGVIYSYTGNHWILSALSNTTRNIILGISSMGKLIVFLSADGTNFFVEGQTGNFADYRKDNTDFWFDISFDSEKYTFKRSLNGINYETDFVINNATKIFTAGLKLGNNESNNNSFQGGSIDLSQFSITVDGKEVFNGNKTGIDTVKINDTNVEIPYTLSKTGSKIVDVAYRDRVINLYEQEGQAGYYTIDEENKNFTLPMGEIYGMIEQAKSSADSKVSKSGDTMTGRLQLNGALNDITPLAIFQQKASEVGKATYGNILFKNANDEEIGIVGCVENTDGSHRIRLVVKNGSDWTEMPQIDKSYHNGTSWYRKYTDGFIEQGFFISPIYWKDNEVKNFALVTPFATTEYTVNATPTERGVSGGNSWGDIAVRDIGTTSINIKNGMHTTTGVRVYACGY